MSKIIDLYFLKCLSNLHAGSGDTTYGIIDKEVQRDAKTEFPSIHSSGLKGSFRELMAFMKDPDDVLEGHKHADVKAIFGSEKETKDDKLKPGIYTFHDAQLLFLPVRSYEKPYFLATSIEQLIDFRDIMQLHYGALPDDFMFLEGIDHLSDKLSEVVISDNYKDARVEDDKTTTLSEFILTLEDADKTLFQTLFNGLEKFASALVLFPFKKMKELVKELPVIARNNLENGISQNLWYEEVVPRQSIFYYFLARPSDNDLLYTEVETGNNNLVQIGGNATVGYGLCKTDRKFSSEFKAPQL